MTQNQLTYMANVEAARANMARETETNRSNLASEAETKRANLAREAETNRYNTLYLNELQRSNAARERIQLLDLSERSRANLANEQLKRESNLISREQMNNQYILGVGNLAETVRSNTSAINLNTERAKQIKAETSLTGTKVASELVGMQLTRARTASESAKARTENTMRGIRKAQGIVSIAQGGLSAVSDAVSSIGKTIALFGG